jgi:hypothetical protein
VATLDIGIVNDRTVLTVMHTEEAEGGRRVVLDRIVRWQGTRAAPVDLGEVRDTLLTLTMEYNGAEVVLDPHRAVLIAQKARGRGVMVHEFAFTATSVGRLALSLHQAIRNHRIALPDDETLMDELVSVRLRKNTLGVYRLDHDSGQHDDQAVALALGTHYLLDADGGAASWIRWARQKAIDAGAVIIDGQPLVMPGPQPRAALPPARSPEPEPALEGIVVDAAGARKAARDAAWRDSPDGVMMRAIMGG